MNKDALLATLIGFGIGLLVTGLLLLGPNLAKSFGGISLPSMTFPSLSLSSFFQKSASSRLTPTPNQPTNETSQFTVDSPLADAIESGEGELVSGNAPPDSLVVISGLTNETVVRVGASGTYAGKVTLSEGKNDIMITNYVNQKATTQTVTVFYTPDTL